MSRIRPTEPRDLEELSALFESRFGHPTCVEEWEWKYRRLPGEARSWIAESASGRLLAHGGALRLPARLPGRCGDVGIWQLTDWAGTTTRGGLRPPLVELGRRLLHDLPRPQDAPWIFGFPSERHFRLGRRVFGYRPLTEIQPLVGPLPPPDAAVAGTPVPEALEISDHCGCWPEAAEAAWDACGVAGVRRTTALLDWRYHARPGRYYRFYRLRAGGGAVGLAVFAFVGLEAHAAELWLPAPPDDPSGAEAWGPALRAVAADLASAGQIRWTFWPPADPALGAVLGRLGVQPSGPPVFVGCRGPGEPDERFYFAMGDYDVV